LERGLNREGAGDRPRRASKLVNAMMTKDEARRALEAELRLRKLPKPMTIEELNAFCEEMYKRLEFKSHSERLADILRWAKAWQAKNLPYSAA
jgi:hypothetical protein